MTHEHNDEMQAITEQFGDEIEAALKIEAPEEKAAPPEQMDATERARDSREERTDDEARSLVGAVVGDFDVLERVKPGKRVRYRCRNRRNGREHYLQGYELVRQVRATVRHGGTVLMPREPWIDKEDA